MNASAVLAPPPPADAPEALHEAASASTLSMPAETIPALFRERVRRHPDRTAFCTLAAGGAGRDQAWSWADWQRAAEHFAAALIAHGHQPGEPVAILAGNTPLWPVADLGVLLAGGVSVGVYPSSAPEQVRQLLADAGAVAAVADDAHQFFKVQQARAHLPALRTVVCQDAPADADGSRWDHWLAKADDAAYAELGRRTAAADDVAILIYTSGSTGVPKGARITHRTALASAQSIQRTLGFTEHDTALSFLPFCHAAERVFGLYTRIWCGMEAALIPDHTRVWEVAREYAPTSFGGLPRFYEKAYEALQQERHGAGSDEAWRWQRVLELGTLRSRLRRGGETLPDPLEAEWRRLGEPLFGRVRDMFGGRVRIATSGGAALPLHVAEFLDALGLTVLGAYGLTEHLCATFNQPDRYTLNSAGPPMPGTAMRIAADGEILIRRNTLTFAGYHGRPEQTRDTFSENGEWLLTGDFGRFDEHGFLHVTGRKKELLALSTGKKVAPLPIESRLVQNPWIAQAMLHGEGRKFVSALLYPRRSTVEAWGRATGLNLTFVQLLRHPGMQREVQAAVDAVNALVSRTEQVRRWVLLDRELSVETGELTPTLKVRRSVVAERYAAQLDALYQSGEGAS